LKGKGKIMKPSPILKAVLLPDESIITVNGIQLTEGQAMTVRVALGQFVMELSHNGLGDDEHGKALVKGYQERAHEIFKLMGISWK
jgi:hypothetical protein